MVLVIHGYRGYFLCEWTLMARRYPVFVVCFEAISLLNFVGWDLGSIARKFSVTPLPVNPQKMEWCFQDGSSMMFSTNLFQVTNIFRHLFSACDGQSPSKRTSSLQPAAGFAGKPSVNGDFPASLWSPAGKIGEPLNHPFCHQHAVRTLLSHPKPLVSGWFSQKIAAKQMFADTPFLNI